MSWLSKLGITIERPSTVEKYQLQPILVDGKILTSASIGDRGVMAVPAAYRGSQMLSDMSAQLPWSSFRGGKHSDQASNVSPARVDPTPSILVDPSPFMTRDDVIRAIVSNLIFRGFAPLYLQNHDVDGRPRFATPLNPDEVSASWDSTMTHVEYRWRELRLVEGFDLAVIEMQRLPGEPKGLGPFDAAAAVISGVSEANEWARDLFGHSAIPSGVLEVPGKLTKDEAKALREQWENQHQGGRATAVLSGGMSYSPTSLTPEQAQFISARGFGIQEVARLLGIPQHFLNAGQIPGTSQSLTYTNIQSIFRELTQVTLYPTYLRRIEEAFSMFLPRGQSASFDLTDFVKADDGTRFTAWKTAIEAGILTVDEVRESEGLAANALSIGEVR